MNTKIVPDTHRMGSYAGGELLQWLKSLPQTTLAELHALNEAWWHNPDSSTKETDQVGKVMGDFIEEHGGDRGWWVSIELEEIPS